MISTDNKVIAVPFPKHFGHERILLHSCSLKGEAGHEGDRAALASAQVGADVVTSLHVPCTAQPVVFFASGRCGQNASVVLACGGLDPPHLHNRGLLSDQSPCSDLNCLSRNLLAASNNVLVKQFVPNEGGGFILQPSQFVEPEGIAWRDCLIIFANFSDLAVPAFKVNLVELDTFDEPLSVVDRFGMFEPSYYEPLPSNARLLDGDGVHRLLALLQLSEGVVTSTFDLLRLGFVQCGSILNLFPSISEDVAVSQGNLSHEGRSKTELCGSFLALFKGANLHVDVLKSWPAELVSLGLQRPSNSLFRV